jgi:hypothetical protein
MLDETTNDHDQSAATGQPSHTAEPERGSIASCCYAHTLVELDVSVPLTIIEFPLESPQ